jgi:hypothetical protein
MPDGVSFWEFLEFLEVTFLDVISRPENALVYIETSPDRQSADPVNSRVFSVRARDELEELIIFAIWDRATCTAMYCSSGH